MTTTPPLFDDETRSALAAADVDLVLPGDAGYDEHRALWNGMFDRTPRAILRPATTSGVAAAVRAATRAGLPVAVKGGGHSAPGYSMCDGDGVAVDLGRLAGAHVDPVTKTATVQGGALLGDLDRATAPHGLVVPAGAISHTGAGGLVLGGGFGHLMRKLGLTIDSLVGAEVVLADGTVVSTDAESEPDLFWAIRGGSGNFGIVTEFRFACHDFGPNVYVSTNVVELADARAVLEVWREVMLDAPDELSWNAFFRGGPDEPGFQWIPEHLRGEPLLLMPLIWAGDPAEGKAWVDRVSELLPPVASRVSAVIPFLDVQRQWDEVFRHGRRHYAKAGFLRDVPPECLEIVLDAAKRLPHPATQVEILRLGGAVARVGADETAFPHRDAAWPVNIIGLWDRAEDDPAVIAWVRELYQAIEPFMSPGTYVNYAGGDETGGTQAAYGSTWSRLTALKDVYDPGNTFRFNANLKASS